MAGIFISYRRDDSAGWTGRLATDLQERFGRESVFQDIGAIQAGENFIAAIEQSLGSCSVVLVVIGPEWTFVKDKTGARRLDNPEDTVRLEVAKALQQKDRLVIPVLVGGAPMPTAAELPADLKALAQRNALELSDKRWDYDLDQLAATLVSKAGLTPPAPAAAPAAGARLIRWLALLSSAVIVTVISLWYFIFGPGGPQSPIAAFSIDQPVNGAELPLGADQSWMLEGKLRLAQEGAPDIAIEVFKLPARQAVAQQGKARISTERGIWRYESATFAGEGSYEIVATISLNSRSDWRSLMVKCLTKASAYQQAIEQDRGIRGVTSVTTVKPNPAELEALKQSAFQLQDEFFRLFPDDLDGAEANAVRTLDMLDPVLPTYPDDWLLQNLRAYALKNYAMVMRNRGQPEEFKRALGEAEKMFEVIRQQQPDDPGAWNGLGSVALLRNDPVSALNYIDRALEIAPGYEAARHDRAIALQMLAEKKQE